MMTASAAAWGLSPSHAVALLSGTGGIPSPPEFIHFAVRCIGGSFRIKTSPNFRIPPAKHAI
jgi:hypothetical protein